MDLHTEFEINRQTRKNILLTINNLNEDIINVIPKGFNNNIAWNIGHILVTHQLLVYGLSGVEMKVPDNWVEKYRKGSRPGERISYEEFQQIKEIFTSTIDWAETDYNAGKFSKFKAYKTSYGFPLDRVEDVLRFVYAHDALHWGVIISILKLI